MRYYELSRLTEGNAFGVFPLADSVAAFISLAQNKQPCLGLLLRAPQYFDVANIRILFVKFQKLCETFKIF